jgi:hypothetical protein
MTCCRITVPTQHSKIIGVVIPFNPSVKDHSATNSQLAPMFTAATVFMINSQEGKFDFSATLAFAAIMIYHLCLEYLSMLSYPGLNVFLVSPRLLCCGFIKAFLAMTTIGQRGVFAASNTDVGGKSLFITRFIHHANLVGTRLTGLARFYRRSFAAFDAKTKCKSFIPC